ncbi:hypothetical protein PoB_002223900 [Plakobranchus ocellatus]|uniref:Uncharacterized protein n=1 Tax=Plakobranchus ocellatus TaxID=259542 RepID=A0AAV3ZMW9_9GAST|nr:hypothetical protein PoB_002223900 [Plakobranchus ocellatus]
MSGRGINYPTSASIDAQLQKETQRVKVATKSQGYCCLAVKYVMLKLRMTAVSLALKEGELKDGGDTLDNEFALRSAWSLLSQDRAPPWATCPQQGDLRLSGPPSGHGAGSGARTRDRRVPADLRADSQATVLPTPPTFCGRM